MTFPPEPVGLTNQPYYIREHKDWAVEQETYRHDQALYSIGEPAMFVLLWTVEDFQHGHTSRCSLCYGNDLDGRQAAVYNQANRAKCPRCYGTTFEGGLRARIIRPALFSETDDEEQASKRGAIHPQSIMVESTNDFRYRSGDFVFRLDGSRWQLKTPSRVTIRTGFEHPGQVVSSMGYSQGPATLEDATSVAYLIPPSGDSLASQLLPDSRWPTTKTDVINGPLIPKAWTD